VVVARRVMRGWQEADTDAGSARHARERHSAASVMPASARRFDARSSPQGQSGLRHARASNEWLSALIQKPAGRRRARLIGAAPQLRVTRGHVLCSQDAAFRTAVRRANTPRSRQPRPSQSVVRSKVRGGADCFKWCLARTAAKPTADEKNRTDGQHEGNGTARKGGGQSVRP
jgi:hypothetical protein